MRGMTPTPNAYDLGDRRVGPRKLPVFHDQQAAKAPPLPKTAPDGQPWSAGARRWWRTWVGVGSGRFTAPQWDQVLVTLALVQEFWTATRGKVGLAGEIRRREELLARMADERPQVREAPAAVERPVRERERIMRLLEADEAR